MEKTFYLKGCLEHLKLPEDKLTDLSVVCIGRVLSMCLREVSKFSADLTAGACLSDSQLKSGAGVITGMGFTAGDLVCVLNADLKMVGLPKIENLVKEVYEYIAAHPFGGCDAAMAKKMALFAAENS